MLSIFWNIVIFIFSLSILITIHELGHFLAARYFNVLVEHFSVGFGKKIWKYINRNGTEFSISLIPLGGYVKMLEMDEEYIEKKDIYKTCCCAFNYKKISQRSVIVIAGSIANFFFAILIYWIIFIIGLPSFRPVVEMVVPSSIAENAQITPDMEFKAIDNIITPDWDAVRLQLVSKIGHDYVTVSVTSPDFFQQQDRILDLRSWNYDLNTKEDPILSLGIYPRNVLIEPILLEVQKNSAASRAGLQAGDKITKVNEQPLTKWTTFVNLVRNNPGKQLTLEIERKGNVLFFVLVPDLKMDNGTKKGFAGIYPKIIPLPDEYKILHKYDPFNAFLKATNKIWQLITLTIKILEKLIIGDIRLNNISGPISIAKQAGIAAKYGIIYYLIFLAFISVNLGVINLLPLPILDGGHLLFLIIEKLNGKMISKKMQDISYRVGIILLIMLMVIAFLNDISRL